MQKLERRPRSINSSLSLSLTDVTWWRRSCAIKARPGLIPSISFGLRERSSPSFRAAYWSFTTRASSSLNSLTHSSHFSSLAWWEGSICRSLEVDRRMRLLGINQVYVVVLLVCFFSISRQELLQQTSAHLNQVSALQHRVQLISHFNQHVNA